MEKRSFLIVRLEHKWKCFLFLAYFLQFFLCLFQHPSINLCQLTVFPPLLFPHFFRHQHLKAGWIQCVKCLPSAWLPKQQQHNLSHSLPHPLSPCPDKCNQHCLMGRQARAFALCIRQTFSQNRAKFLSSLSPIDSSTRRWRPVINLKRAH